MRLMLLMRWCCWWADVADALIFLMCWSGWSTDPVDALILWCADPADALILLLHWSCWCAYLADALTVLVRWCCWCADAIRIRIRSSLRTFLKHSALVPADGQFSPENWSVGKKCWLGGNCVQILGESFWTLPWGTADVNVWLKRTPKQVRQ